MQVAVYALTSILKHPQHHDDRGCAVGTPCCCGELICGLTGSAVLELLGLDNQDGCCPPLAVGVGEPVDAREVVSRVMSLILNQDFQADG